MLNKLKLFPIFLVLFEVSVYLSTDMYLPAMPNIGHFFNLDIQTTQASLGAWFLGSGSCPLLLGPISDHIGRKPIMIIAIIIFTLTCIICAKTTNYYLFLLARFAQGAMIGPIFVGGYAAIHEKFPEQSTVKIIAIMGLVTIAAPTIGPFFGSLVLHKYKWQTIFNILASSAIIFGTGIFLCMPETLKTKHPFIIKNIGKNYLKAFSSFRFIGPIMTNCCTFAAMIIWLTLGIFLTQKLSIDENSFCLIQACAFGSYILGNRIIPFAIKKFKMEHIVMFGLGFGLGLGCIFILLFKINPSNLIAISGLSLITFGAGMCGPNLQKLAMNSSDEPMGLKLAIYTTLISLSGALFSFSASWVSASWINLLTLMLCCLIIACIIHSTWIKRCQT